MNHFKSIIGVVLVILLVSCTNNDHTTEQQQMNCTDEIISNLEGICLKYKNQDISFSMSERRKSFISDYYIKYLGTILCSNERFEILQKTVLSGTELDALRANIAILLFSNGKLFGTYYGLDNTVSVNVSSNTLKISTKETHITTTFDMSDSIPNRLFVQCTRDSNPLGYFLYLTKP